jgi:HD superfamily phosphodiesterase
MVTLISKLFHFVLLSTAKYGIDESHGVSHSMNILHYANKIYNSELPNFPSLKDQERTIYVSAIIHDMCDKKYMKEEEGVKQIEDFLQEQITKEEIDTTKLIISTMSYSKVKKNGFPNIPDPSQELAYHIVRESDLLTAYDFDRSMMYHMHQSKADINQAYQNAYDLFENRIFRHEDDGLLLTDFSKNEALILKTNALHRIQTWKTLLKNPTLF